MGRLGQPDDMRMESMGNLFVYEEQGINFDEKELDQVNGVSLEVIRVAADSLLLEGQREGD